MFKLACESEMGVGGDVLHRQTQTIDPSSEACTGLLAGGWQLLLDKRPRGKRVTAGRPLR